MRKSAIGGQRKDDAPIQQLPQSIAGRPVALAKFNKSQSKLLFAI